MSAPVSFAQMLSTLESDTLSRLTAKVPEWAGVQGLSVPDRLCAEQCSGSAAARYKASVAHSAAGAAACTPSLSIADLTGGLGVDSWAFSRCFDRVLYNEMNPRLCEAVRANFALLGVSNTQFSCQELTPASLPSVLGDFRPDVIYLDPARRAASGRKVFLLEDCSPDILSLQEALLEAAPVLLVKVSPMADITMLSRRLGPCLQEIHVVGSGGECKELLCLLRRGAPAGELRLILREGEWGEGFTLSEARDAAPAFTPAQALSSGWIFEPSATLLKSGGADLLCSRAGLTKLAPFTHLWHAQSPSEALRCGKWRRIAEVLPFSGAALGQVAAKYPRSEVLARNLTPSGRGTVDTRQLRSRLGVASGTDAYIIGCTSLEGGSLIIVCEF